MDALDALMTRRSIRSYTPEPVSDEQITTMLRAALQAPSALDERPWQFVVTRDRALFAALDNPDSEQSMLRECGVAILVCGDTQREKIPGFWVQDCSCAAQNILLAAYAMGLGAVWLAMYSLEKNIQILREHMDLPHHIEPLALIPVGYPAEELGFDDRYEEALIHTERW